MCLVDPLFRSLSKVDQMQLFRTTDEIILVMAASLLMITLLASVILSIGAIAILFRKYVAAARRGMPIVVPRFRLRTLLVVPFVIGASSNYSLWAHVRLTPSVKPTSTRAKLGRVGSSYRCPPSRSSTVRRMRYLTTSAPVQRTFWPRHATIRG